MSFEVASWIWMLTALIILATVCMGVFKAIRDNISLIRRGPRDFLLDRLARHGDHFTISLLGGTQLTVVSSPETMKFVLSSAHACFREAYPSQFMRLLSVEKYVGEGHAHFRKIILSAVSGEKLQKLVPFISSLAEKTVKSWENSKQGVVDSVDELQKFVFNVAMHIIWRDIEPGSEEMDQIRNEYVGCVEGLGALPINFPGFPFNKAMKAREVLMSYIQTAISRRRKAGIQQQDDVLDAFMSIREFEVPDYNICCLMLTVMFAAASTIASVIPFVLKYLDNFPEVCQRVQDEQDRLCQKMTEDKSLTWFKAKSSMPYTLQVIYEVMRFELLVTFPRLANKDVVYNGFLFHKDSFVWASATSLHHDPKYYPNPQEFDPSRFESKSQPNAFMPFGHGIHLCPASELALTQTMFIMHHLVTNYSWGKCGLDKGVKEFPMRKLVGFPIRLVKRCKT